MLLHPEQSGFSHSASFLASIPSFNFDHSSLSLVKISVTKLAMLSRSLFGLATALVATVGAFPYVPRDGSLPTPRLFPRAACGGNTASTRDEWCDYSIDTDYTSGSWTFLW